MDWQKNSGMNSLQEIINAKKGGSAKTSHIPITKAWERRGEVDRRKSEEQSGASHMSNARCETQVLADQTPDYTAAGAVFKKQRIDVPDHSPVAHSTASESIMSGRGSGVPSVGIEPSDDALRHDFRQHGLPFALFGESREQRIRRWQETRRMRTDQSVSPGSAPQKTGGFHLAVAEEFYVNVADPHGLCSDVIDWMRQVFEGWMADLDRKQGEYEGSNGKASEFNQFRQTQDQLKPLVSLLNSNSIDPTICGLLRRITDAASMRRYMDANSVYMELSIGNKPWPIGVGNCFIQERSSMDRIATSSHLLNDEVARRYVQSLKRLLTQAERLWPSEHSAQTFTRIP